MYFHNQKIKPDGCLICHQNLGLETTLSYFLQKRKICSSCFHSFEHLDLHTHLDAYPLTILYYYNDFFKTLLFRYKGQYDYALKDAFLEGYQSALQTRYRDYLVVIVPSDQGSNEKRKFIPNLAIAQSFSSQVIMPITKTKPYKQSDQPFASRDQVASVLALKEVLPAHQKLLLFDDVITSGATLRACAKLLADSHPQCLELLVLASHSPDNFQP